VRSLFRGVPEDRAKPELAPDVRESLRNTSLTCSGLGQPGWRQMVRAGDRTTSNTPRNQERRGHARAEAGAVNTTGAVVNYPLASFAFGGRTHEP
jgi:hypothetical protein